MSEHDYWQMIRDLVDKGYEYGKPKHEISEDIVHRVHIAHDAGEPWAADVMTRWLTRGADDDYTRVFKDMNTVTYVRANGRRVRKTVAYSMPMRDKESGAIIGRQIQAWWGMSRAAVAALREEWLERAEQATEALAALDQILTAMDRHPGCKTARDAWEAGGHDVGEIELAMVGGTS